MIEERLAAQMIGAMALLPNGAVKTALQALFAHYRVSQAVVARHMGVSGSSLSRALDRLQGQPENNREYICRVLEAVAETSATPPRSPNEVAERFIGELEEANTLELPTTPHGIAVERIAQMLDSLTDSDLELVERMVERLRENGNVS